MNSLENLFGGLTMPLTELHRASTNCDAGEVRRLLGQGADVHARDGDGNTPLRITASIEVAELLLSKGADVNAANDEGLTPLHRAALIANAGLALLYVKSGADVEPGTSRTTPLTTAARSGHDFQMALLVKHGANPNVTDERGVSPLNHTQAQSMRDLFLLLSALDTIIGRGEGDIAEHARALRSRAIETVDATMLRGVIPPGDVTIPADTGPRAIAQWEEGVRVRCRDMRQQIRLLEDTLERENPKLAMALVAEKQRLDSANVVMDERLRGIPPEELKRRLDAILNPKQSPQVRQLAVPWWHRLLRQTAFKRQSKKE